ncbi:MAG: hypothetical protein H8D22_01420, partial [Candidatus Cloacimonetes bacterium]|nr:hypothetical protein [Candidatus Cloacimonadota bacterium]
MKSKKKSYFIITLVSLLILLSSVLSAQDIEINNISHFSTSPLIINEIMFKPNTSAGNKEWIEIFN